MDVDQDLDGQLLQQFSSMGTDDKEVLVSEFQRLLDNKLNPAGCAFFLDMNNWNLQAAVCSYYDFEQPNMKVPSMSFVKDITIGEGESVPPNTRFVKTWRVQNTGDEAWPPACNLKFIGGEQFGVIDRAMVDALQPGAVTDISIDMCSPSVGGIFQGQWRMSTPTGMFFGETIWVILQVEDTGLLSVTQQMSQFGSELSHPIPSHVPVENPFASPVKLGSGQTTPMYPMGSPASVIPLGSPASVIAQHGSTPNSPHQHDTSSSSIHLSTSPLQSSARVALFQNSDTSPSQQQIIPFSSTASTLASLSSTVLQSSESHATSEAQEDMDSEMS